MKRLIITLMIGLFCLSFSTQEVEYSTSDLIGKGSLKLYGAEYSLQKEAH